MREEVKRFAEAMETELKHHDKRKGVSWKKMSLFKIEQMIKKAVETVEYEGQDIDVANLCMMHFDNERRLNDK